MVSKGTPLVGCKGNALSENDEDMKEGPVNLSQYLKSFLRLRCAEGETLAGGSKGATPHWQV